MPSFDDMLDAVRNDCGTPALRSAAELRGLGARRTTIHRAVGGAVSLTVVAGLTTGLVLYGPGTGTRHDTGTPLASANTSAQTSPAPVSPAPASAWPSMSAPPVSPPQVPPPPVSPDPLRSSDPSSTRAITPETQGTGCTIADFDTQHATKTDDDASGIIGYDIGVRYLGTSSCPISALRMAYTDGAGHRVIIPQDTPPSGHHSIKHDRTLTLTVYGRDHNGENPLPPSCAHPTTYRGLSISINGAWTALPGLTATLPCGGPTTMWLAP